jgi:hypothetical protein
MRNWREFFLYRVVLGNTYNFSFSYKFMDMFTVYEFFVNIKDQKDVRYFGFNFFLGL